MKLSLLITAIAVGLITCNSETKEKAPKTDSAVVKEATIYPFTPKYS